MLLKLKTPNGSRNFHCFETKQCLTFHHCNPSYHRPKKYVSQFSYRFKRLINIKIRQNHKPFIASQLPSPYYAGQQKICQEIDVLYFPHFGSLTPIPTIAFKSMGPIFQCSQFRGFSVENYIFEFSKNFWTFLFLIWKGNKIGSSLQKIIQIGQPVLEISYFEVKKSSKFCHLIFF